LANQGRIILAICIHIHMKLHCLLI